ncbi:MAG TPA: phenylalanine--tRNA ligase beta subunit-related protein [Candidatus Acidoferrales bacterium]|nr:phenylalanine--tRNA ligase beta subunit-related protein [Candidatus Acidoferrales bacterium]
MNITIEIPGVRIGIVEADDVAVAAVNAELLAEIGQECSRLRKKFTVESLAEASAIVAVRAMFRGWGMDPSKYRPSSEALLRRVVQGKGLYNISNIVDLTNLGSIETAWPYGVYNREAISGEIALRLGAAGEKYEGIGRRVWHLEGRPVLADADGPFGSPISDSTRTQVRDGVSQVLTVIYAPAGAAVGEVEQSVQKQAHRLKFHAEAQAVRTNLIQPIT